MPHLTIEYSANLEAEGRIAALCQALRATLLGTGLLEEGAIRVRALPCPHYAVADMLPENAFAAMVLRVGAGRDISDRQAVGRSIMAVAEAHFASQLAQPHFALSLDMIENDPTQTWKTNSIHPRLRAG